MKNIFFLFLLLFVNSCVIFKKNNSLILDKKVSQQTFTHNKKFAWFDQEYNSYTPNNEIVNQLKPLKNELKVLVIAGTWCGDTQRELPRFYKLANQIGIPEENIALILVDENKKSKYLNVSVLEVTNVPTFIFFKDGKEQGRIIEKPKNSLEEDLANLLALM
jgi:thiol-disulfide isomerase/thioredoxin